MKPVLATLLDILRLERLEESLFRGQSQDLGWGAIFGGQVVGQALSAAQQTAPEDRVVHAIHGVFLRRGEVSRPVIYDVDRVRDGRSFTSRRVVAIQNGEVIFHLSASFQVVEDGLEHQSAAPSVRPPEGLLSEDAIARRFADQIPPMLRAQAVAERPVEIRVIDPRNPMSPDTRPPLKHMWMRASDALPDEPWLHQALLAYASDFHFLTTSLHPHGVSWLSPGMQSASLDHSVWFHRPFRMDEWLLHEIESPSASAGRGLVRGRIFTQDGVLVASTAQEGVIRQR